MDIEHKTRLTSSELTYLWGAYISDSMSICVFKYFLVHVEDKNIKTLIEHALDIAQEHVVAIEEVLSKENIQIPVGFKEEDVNLKANRLFSDIFYIYYVKNMVTLGLSNQAATLPFTFRKDIESFVSKSISSSVELNNETTHILLEKGLMIRSPYLPYPTDVEFVHKKSFILEMLGKRPLISAEVTTLFANLLTNNLGLCVSAGFAQVSASKEISEYFLRGKEISIKHIKVFSSYLAKHSLPISQPLAINQDITDSKESPFSDKLLLYHFLIMNRAGISNYGLSMSSSMRSDLIVDFSRLMTEIMKFSEDGLNILIKNNWLERPPLATYRGEE